MLAFTLPAQSDKGGTAAYGSDRFALPRVPVRNWQAEHLERVLQEMDADTWVASRIFESVLSTE